MHTHITFFDEFRAYFDFILYSRACMIFPYVCLCLCVCMCILHFDFDRIIFRPFIFKYNETHSLRLLKKLVLESFFFLLILKTRFIWITYLSFRLLTCHLICFFLCLSLFFIKSSLDFFAMRCINFMI